jgi:hypothetical protein
MNNLGGHIESLELLVGKEHKARFPLRKVSASKAMSHRWAMSKERD